jgi:hypothetical protein
MRKSRKFSGCNMFIMRKDLFFQYSEWLFNILEEFEKKVIEQGFKKEIVQEKFMAGERFIGCIAERLFNLRFMHQSKN